MWRAYSSVVSVTDFKSALDYICDELSKNIFEYEHEAVYGMGRYLSEEECNSVASENEKALTLTQMYRNNSICGRCWALAVMQIKKFPDLGAVFENLPKDVQLEIAFPSYNVLCYKECDVKIEQEMKKMGNGEEMESHQSELN